MNVIILMTSPDTDGLTAACAEAARQGILEAGGSAEFLRLNDLNIQHRALAAARAHAPV